MLNSDECEEDNCSTSSISAEASTTEEAEAVMLLNANYTNFKHHSFHQKEKEMCGREEVFGGNDDNECNGECNVLAEPLDDNVQQFDEFGAHIGKLC